MEDYFAVYTIGAMLYSLFQFVCIFFFISFIINRFLRAKGYRGPKSDHFDGVHFKNILEEVSLREKRADKFFHGFSFFTKKMFTTRWRKRTLPYGEANVTSRVPGRHIVVTFINHSTVLIQTEGINIITDPLWSKRASPFPFLGPARYMPPGIAIEKLPPIDIILLTHNHYDHMDIAALKKITQRDKPTLYTTLGNKRYLETRGIYNSIEMDWGGAKTFGDMISIECVPAQHFSARALSDRNKTLWAGFVIRTPHGDIYFAGDTGYGPFISHIKKAYPDGFRLAFLPVGAFEPRWFMHSVHIGPSEAVMMYDDLKVEEAVAIHLGTFDLGIDAQDEPAEKIKDLLSDPQNAHVRFTILQNGETKTIE